MTVAKRRVVERQLPTLVERWVEFDLGDGEIVLDEFSDGAYVLRVNDEPPIVLSTAATVVLVGAFAAIGKAKGWLVPEREHP